MVRVNGKDFFFKEGEGKGEGGGKSLSSVKITKRDFGEEKVLAPISGQIIKIFKKEGEAVRKGEGILILSAMKMENEILVEKDGTIKRLFVGEGDAVKKGDALAIIK